jgi:phosphatidylglycerol:prolipoprotein diacylglycerol transferase
MTVTRAREPAGRRGFPGEFRIAGHRVNSYKVFLCAGLYAAILASAAAAERAGFSPLRMGLGALLCAIAGLIGARAYHLALNLRAHRRAGLRASAFDPRTGGWSVFGGLVLVPFSLLLQPLLGMPLPVFWDHLAFGAPFGGALIRFGCVCNGCCVGRESLTWLALRQHDVHGVVRRRLPAQWLEIGWWLLACAGIVWLWLRHWPAGSYGLAVLAWYGVGRIWLEALREPTDVVGGVRVNRVVAALLALVAGAGFVLVATGD